MAGAPSRLAGQMGVRRIVRLLMSPRVEVPTVIGWLRPVLIVPAAFFSTLPPEQVEAILAHELAHIRRHDYLVNLIQIVIETLLFYHPAVVVDRPRHPAGARELLRRSGRADRRRSSHLRYGAGRAGREPVAAAGHHAGGDGWFAAGPHPASDGAARNCRHAASRADAVAGGARRPGPPRSRRLADRAAEAGESRRSLRHARPGQIPIPGTPATISMRSATR